MIIFESFHRQEAAAMEGQRCESRRASKEFIAGVPMPDANAELQVPLQVMFCLAEGKKSIYVIVCSVVVLNFSVLQTYKKIVEIIFYL